MRGIPGGFTAWGDNLTLEAMARMFRRQIDVIQDSDDPIMNIVPPNVNRSLPVIVLAHYTELHYENTQALPPGPGAEA